MGDLPDGMEVIDGILHIDGTPAREWEEETPNGIDLSKLTWENMLGHWDAIETDFAHFFHLDLEDQIPKRTWRWFTIRVFRLLGEDTLLARLLGIRDTERATNGT